MAETVHGHDVMQMMIDSNKTYTKESLEKAIIERFGNDTRFYTCSAENMTAAEIIEFLASRGKFDRLGGGFKTNPDKICKH